MSETMKFTLDIGFNTFGFQEIDAITDCNNIGSRKLLEKFDFELDDKFESEETGSVRYFLVNRSNANTNVNGT
jgi:RimJ/RimL family protein N-acetyltransferase